MNYLVKDSLTLDVFIIGYKTQGESIILVVKSDGIVCYTCIIDCYEHKKINKTVQLLDELKIQFVNTICWTHPDIDHSIGIEKILLNYSNKNTTVVIPEGLDGDRESIDYNKHVKNTFELINSEIIKRHSSFYVMSASDRKIITSDVYFFGEKKYVFDITSVTPSSYLIRKRALYSTRTKNDYSIALRVTFGELDLFLGSDIENVNIDLMKHFLSDYIPSSFNLLKIPHHTSFSSKNLLQLLDKSKKSDISCSTVYRRKKLPESDLIDLYKLYSKEFYCTGNIENQCDNYDYGCIHINYNLLQNEAIIELSGNANNVFEFTSEPTQQLNF